MLNRPQGNFAHVTTVIRVQNVVVIRRVYVKPEYVKFWSNFEFDRNIVCGTGAWPRHQGSTRATQLTTISCGAQTRCWHQQTAVGHDTGRQSSMGEQLYYWMLLPCINIFEKKNTNLFWIKGVARHSPVGPLFQSFKDNRYVWWWLVPTGPVAFGAWMPAELWQQALRSWGHSCWWQ